MTLLDCIFIQYHLKCHSAAWSMINDPCGLNHNACKYRALGLFFSSSSFSEYTWVLLHLIALDARLSFALSHKYEMKLD